MSAASHIQGGAEPPTFLQILLPGECGVYDVRRHQVWIACTNGSVARTYAGGIEVGVRIRIRGIQYNRLDLMIRCASLHRLDVSDIVDLIRDSGAGTNHSSVSRLIRDLSGRPEIMIGAQILLRLVAHSGSEIEFRIHSPVRLNKTAKLQLAQIDDGIACRFSKCDRMASRIIGKAREREHAKIVRFR